jgi:hypothetical protein
MAHANQAQPLVCDGDERRRESQCNLASSAAEPSAAADGGRDTGFSAFTVAQRGRRG